jgi:hypothetical protein
MTEQQTFAEADEVYDAEPGTEPDGWSFIPAEELTDDPEQRRAALEGRLAKWRPEMTFFRVTDTTGEFAKPGQPEGIWLEVWKSAPDKQAPFNPPLSPSQQEGGR